MIRTMTDSDVAAAARLLAERHAEHRAVSPLLAPLDQARAETEVRALLQGAGSWVAEEEGAVVGYLIAAEHQRQSLGPNAFVQGAGFAGARLPELYAEAAATWRAEGRDAHFVLCPSHQVEPWFHLGFGVQHVHAARPATPLAPDPRVRRAARADVPVLAELDLVLDTALTASPVFSTVTPSTLDQARQEWEEAVDDPRYATFVAEVDGRVLGSAIGVDVRESSGTAGLLRPERAGHLGFAAVLPEGRGRGLGRALGAAVVTWAATEGYPVITCDWRSANLEAARTWPALGWSATFLRLHRQLPP